MCLLAAVADLHASTITRVSESGNSSHLIREDTVTLRGGNFASGVIYTTRYVGITKGRSSPMVLIVHEEVSNLVLPSAMSFDIVCSMRFVSPHYPYACISQKTHLANSTQHDSLNESLSFGGHQYYH